MAKNSESIPIIFAGVELYLLGERAVWMPRSHTLIVADVHLGKGTAFRKFGLPVPAGSSDKSLSRLTNLIESTAAQHLLILGDLIHARASHDDRLHDAFLDWRKTHGELAMTLVRGNHDRSAGRLSADWNVNEVEEPWLNDGLNFCHAPEHPLDALLAGHIHPVFAVRDFDRSSVSLPCFVVERQRILLPAFGNFTGGHRIHRGPDREIYIAGGQIIRKVEAD